MMTDQRFSSLDRKFISFHNLFISECRWTWFTWPFRYILNTTVKTNEQNQRTENIPIHYITKRDGEG